MGANSVELIGYYGGDETHALSAWTSTRREIDDDRKERIGDLLKFLAQNGHHTPFEKSFLHFLVTCDTASHIHLLKHRVGVSINAESARYKELKDDKWYIPEDWSDILQKEVSNYIGKSYTLYHELIKRLTNEGVDRKRAKESARFILPYANQLTMDVGFNFRSFMHFQHLRNKPEAQKEIRDIAEQMMNIVRDIPEFKMSVAAFC